MRKDDTIPREVFRPGDRTRAFITEVKKDINGPQIFCLELVMILWRHFLHKKYQKFMMV